MSTPAITNKLFQLKKNRRKSAEDQQTSDPEILALLNQIDLGAQNGASNVPAGISGSSGPVNPGQVRPVR